MEKRYEIRAAVYHVSLKVGERNIYTYPVKIGHHFWVLVEIDNAGQEQIIEAIHGMAVQHRLDKAGARRTAVAPLFGAWNCQLKVYCITHPARRDKAISEWTMPYDKDYWMEPSTTFTVHHHTDQHDTLAIWENTKQFINTLNRGEFSYSFCGVGKSFGLNCRNSNSVYAAIAKHLGFEPHRFEGYRAPGLNTPLLSPAMLKYSGATLYSAANNDMLMTTAVQTHIQS